MVNSIHTYIHTYIHKWSAPCGASLRDNTKNNDMCQVSNINQTGTPNMYSKSDAAFRISNSNTAGSLSLCMFGDQLIVT